MFNQSSKPLTRRSRMSIFPNNFRLDLVSEIIFVTCARSEAFVLVLETYFFEWVGMWGYCFLFLFCLRSGVCASGFMAVKGLHIFLCFSI